MKWTRFDKWINFEASGYLRNALEEKNLRIIAETVFARILSKDIASYPEEACEYLNSQKYLDGN